MHTREESVALLSAAEARACTAYATGGTPSEFGPRIVQLVPNG